MHRKPLGRLLIIATTTLAFALATPVAAATYQDTYTPANPSPAAIGGDALLVRPVSLVATAAGSALFVVALPFALINQSVAETGEKLVVTPARYTFIRPLGQFREGGRVPR